MTTEYYMKTIRERITLEFKKRGFTSTKKFAKMCDVSYTTMYRLMNKEDGVSLATLVTIANALNKPLSWILGIEEK